MFLSSQVPSSKFSSFSFSSPTQLNPIQSGCIKIKKRDLHPHSASLITFFFFNFDGWFFWLILHGYSFSFSFSLFLTSPKSSICNAVLPISIPQRATLFFTIPSLPPLSLSPSSFLFWSSSFYTSRSPALLSFHSSILPSSRPPCSFHFISNPTQPPTSLSLKFLNASSECPNTE